MKKILIIIFCIPFLIGTIAFGIEKTKPKPTTSWTQDSGRIVKSGRVNQPVAGASSKLKKRPDYDDFVDKNNNGIDDRAEQKRVKIKEEKPRDKVKAVSNKKKPTKKHNQSESGSTKRRGN